MGVTLVDTLKRVREILQNNTPYLYIAGHSHILKVMPDRKLNLLHMNPGACGNHGWHKLTENLTPFLPVHEGKIADVEAIELGKPYSVR